MKWKGIPCSWVGRITIVKMSTLPKAIHRFNAIYIKIPMSFFKEIEQKIIKFCMEPQKTLNSQSNPKKQEQRWSYHTTSLQINYRVTIIKTSKK